MKKDKQKVIGEYLSDERLKELLKLQPPAGEDPALHILTRAYRALRADDFKRFLCFYAETGLPLNPKNSQGQGFLETLSQQGHARPYLAALTECGAA
ncbi:MAG: PA4642 family protein [Endozoicomonas sp.]